MQAALAGLAGRQGGVFTAAQALAHGYSRDEIRARLSSARWLRVRRGIFRGAGPIDAHRIAVAAAVLACTANPAAASHRSAAHLLGIPTLGATGRVEITVPPDARTTSVKGCVLHHAPLYGSCLDVDGVRTTMPARTAVDIARSGSFADGVVAADHVLRFGTSAEQLAAAAARLRGFQGHRSVERVLAFADGRSESVGESVARVVFAEQGLPAPLVGEPITSDGQLLGVVDFLWPRERTAAEFDGQLKYLPDNDRGPDALWQEKLREDRIRDSGVEVVRVTWADVTERPAEVARRVRTAFGRARHRVAAP